MASLTWNKTVTLTCSFKMGNSVIIQSTSEQKASSVTYSGDIPPTYAKQTSAEIAVTGKAKWYYQDRNESATTFQLIISGKDSTISSNGIAFLTEKSCKYKKPASSKEEIGSIVDMNQMNGNLARSGGTVSDLMKFLHGKKTGLYAKFKMVSDAQQIRIGNNSNADNAQFSVVITINYSYTASSLKAPSVSVTPTNMTSNGKVTYTVDDYNKQTMSNEKAATIQLNHYKSYYKDSPDTIVKQGTFSDLTVTTKQSDTTNRTWQYEITPTWDLTLCYVFGTALKDAGDTRLNSDYTWSQPVTRTASVTTPLNLSFTTSDHGSHIALRWYRSVASGWDSADIYYRIKIVTSTNKTYNIYVKNDTSVQYQEYDIPDASLYFTANHQTATITIQASLKTNHYYPSGESNSITFTYTAYQAVKYFDGSEWKECSVHYWKEPFYLTKSTVEDFMRKNYRSSIDLLHRPLISRTDLEDYGWSPSYDTDPLCPQTFYNSTSKNLLILTPIQDDRSLMDYTALGNKSSALGPQTDPVQYDIDHNEQRVIVDWIGGVSTADLNTVNKTEQNHINLLQRLMQIYYIEAPAIYEQTLQDALNEGRSQTEALTLAEMAEQAHYASLDTVLSWMKECDRNHVVSGWVTVIPFIWTGSAWKQCTF